jgi:hypothetical protein
LAQPRRRSINAESADNGLPALRIQRFSAFNSWRGCVQAYQRPN